MCGSAGWHPPNDIEASSGDEAVRERVAASGGGPKPGVGLSLSTSAGGLGRKTEVKLRLTTKAVVDIDSGVSWGWCPRRDED